MEEFLLEVVSRDRTGKKEVAKLRKESFIPAVLYGKNKKAVSLSISSKELNRFLHSGRIENALVKLSLKDDKAKAKEIHSLVQEIQFNPVKDNILHIDFKEISLTETIKIKVPLTPKGEAIGVKQDGGSLEHLLWELDIECLPLNVPKEIAIDVSRLKIGEGIHIKDIPVLEGVKILHDPEILVLSVAAPVKEEVAPVEGTGEAAPTEPEVIKKKKEEAAEGEEEPKEAAKQKEEKK